MDSTKRRFWNKKMMLLIAAVMLIVILLAIAVYFCRALQKPQVKLMIS